MEFIRYRNVTVISVNLIKKLIIECELQALNYVVLMEKHLAIFNLNFKSNYNIIKYWCAFIKHAITVEE